MTRDNPQTTPKKDDFRLRCARANELDHLQRPTHTRRAPFSGCHGEGKERFKTLSSEPIDWDEFDWFHDNCNGPQGSAKHFFESLPMATLDALDVVIVEGDRPGSSYFAAELEGSVDKANEVAEKLGQPFRFRGQ